MTAAILQFENRGDTCRVNVRPGQCIVIGASNSSDIQLDDANHVAPLHCEVSFASGTLAIKNLTGGQRPLHVNGQPIKRQRLSDGDQFDVGDHRFEVILKTADEPQTAVDHPPVVVPLTTGVVAATATAGASQTSMVEFPVSEMADETTPASASATSPAEAATTDAEPSVDTTEPFHILENGLRKYSVDGDNPMVVNSLQNETKIWQVLMLVNSKLSKSEYPDKIDLLAEYDVEFSAENRLHRVVAAEIDDFWNVYAQLQDTKSAILLAVRSRALPEDQDLVGVAGWFLTPTRLNFNLENGSESLLKKLFSMADLIVAPRDDSSGHFCYTLEATITHEEMLISWMNGNTE